MSIAAPQQRKGLVNDVTLPEALPNAEPSITHSQIARNDNIIRVNKTTADQMIFGKWWPTNSVIYIQPPLANSPIPMFAWRVTPYIPTAVIEGAKGTHMIQNLATLQGNDTNRVYYLDTDEYSYGHPFTPMQETRVFGGLTNGVFQPVRGIACVQYAEEPPPSRVCKTHRGWWGDIAYRFRTTANFTTQAHERLGTVSGRPDIKSVFTSLPLGIQPATSTLLNSPSSEIANGWITVDMSEKKHAEILVKYDRNFDYFDEHAAAVFMGKDWDDNLVSQPADQEFMDSEQYIVWQLIGDMVTNNAAQVQITIEYMLIPGFQLFKPIAPFVQNTRGYKVSVLRYGSFEQALYYDASFASYVIGDHGIVPNTWPRFRLPVPLSVTINGLPTTLEAGVFISLGETDNVNTRIKTYSENPSA